VADTKQDIADKINALLGLDPPIDFKKLKEAELKRLLECISKIPSLIQTGARASLERVMQGPVIKSVREVANMPVIQRLREMREAGGLIGMLDRRMKKQGEVATGQTKKPDETA